MARSNRAKSDASQPKSPTARKSLQLSPRQSIKLNKYREDQLQSPTSPTTHRAPRGSFENEPLPSTPEEWIEFTRTKLRQAAASLNAVDTVMELADLEPDLLEFLLTADEGIRDTVSEAICELPFPTTREAWEDSIVCYLLERFRIFFNRLPPKLVDRKVDEEGRQLVYLTAALEALGYLGFEITNNPEQHEEQEDPFFKVKSKSQKKRKASISIANRARRNTNAVDPRVFKAVDVEFPTSLQESMEVQSVVLLRLQEVLQVFLASFANPELAAHARILFSKQTLEFVPSKLCPATIPETPTDAGLTNAPDPGAFPHIRPLAAARYFDEGPTLGAWSIIIAGRAVTNLRQMRKRDSHGFDMVQKKITELSQGFFSDSNQKRLIGLGTEVPIYEAKVSRDMRIVYQIDLDTDVDAKVDRQIIRVYGVYTHAQLDNRMWSQISQYLNRRGKEYRSRCLHRSTYRAPGQNVTMPAEFDHKEDLDELVEIPSLRTPSQRNTTIEGDEDLDALIALEKFIPMSQNLISTILNDTATNDPFQPSPKEKEIIYHDSACFVLGRSGTGKTTCIVFKILGIEMLFASMKELTKPRQVFVTQSIKLAQNVQAQYQDLIMSLGETLIGSKLGANEEQVLIDLDDEDASAFGLPPKYSMLEDRHFPLFVSFSQLCSLLEADFGLQFGRPLGPKAHSTTAKRPRASRVIDPTLSLDQEHEALHTDQNAFSPTDFTHEFLEHEHTRAEKKQAMINFGVFCTAYWPRFDQRLTKGLDPALVYSEFLGVIEGSEGALGTKSGALSREEYTRGSYRTSSFTSERDCVYDLYEAYRRRRGQLGSYDTAERTHALLMAANAGIPGQKIDSLYIDEAQDNLLIDIKLLHNLSSNPHGIFMAGDTAQTISAGSSFRFEDLKAFMWRLEEQDEAVRRKKRSAIHPVLFHLAVNYRSHGGIVDCASAVVQLISELFPDSIDKLKKETGLVGGPRPVFFSGWEHGGVRFDQFLRGEDNINIDSGSPSNTTSFGASQAILVRNDAVRAALCAQVGEIGLILTLYESKGLEFDDVLLYNFFEDSLPSASTWRVVLRGLHTGNVGSVPNLDELRHSVICAELKHLYVGLTRARKHCWIWDASDKAEPMKAFWMEQGLVSVCGPGDPVPRLGVSSSEDDWAKRGRSLFSKQLYPQAVFCFGKANLVVERDIAAAYEARKQARLLQASESVDEASKAFIHTAVSFLRCSEHSAKKQRISCYLRAAECFLEAEDWGSAAEAFLSASEFNLAAKNFRRAGRFDEAVDVVKKHRGQMQGAVAEEIIGIAKLEYLRTEKLEQAGELFNDVEEQLEYMGDYGFNTAQIHVLESRQLYGQAAKVAFGEHNIMEGIRLLLCSDDTSSVGQANEKILDSLWILLPFGPYGTKLENTSIALLIGHLKNNRVVLSKGQISQLDVFQGLYAQDLNRLIALAGSHGRLTHKLETQLSANLASAISLLCFSYSSQLLVPAKDWAIPTFVARSKLAFVFFSQLLHLGRTLNLTCSNTQRLLGFERIAPYSVKEPETNGSTTTEFWIHSTSLMFNNANNILGAREPTTSDLGISSLVLSEVDTRRLASSAIFSTLRSEIKKIGLNNAVDYSRYVNPCLECAILGGCNRDDCRKQDVASLKLPEGQSRIIFNLRVQALLAQVENIHLYHSHDITECRVLRRTWSRRAYELLMPCFPPLGSLVCIDEARVPEEHRGLHIISIWCEDALHYTDPKYGVTVLSDIVVYLDLALRVEGASARFSAYVDRLHSTRLVNWRSDLMRPPNYAYSQHSIVRDFIDFYSRKLDDVIARIVSAMHHVVTRPLAIEANVLVQTLEFIGREVIIHYRQRSRGPRVEGAAHVLDQTTMPQSWARDLIMRPILVRQTPFVLFDFLNTLLTAIELLHNYELDIPRVLLRFNSSLTPLERSILIMRICRLLILIACNIGFPPPEKDRIRINVAHLLAIPGNLHSSCIRFARASSWRDFEDALTHSPLNQGADKLVFLALRTGSILFPPINGTKTIRYSNIFPELAQILSSNETTKHPKTLLNPGAKAFTPSALFQGPTNSYGEAQLTNNPFTVPDPSQHDDLSLMPNPQIMPDPTAREVIMGRKILFCYREYAARQHVKAEWAVRVIWTYYTRYRLRHIAPQTATGDKIRKLHREYVRDAERAVSLLPVKRSNRYGRILLGYMPHVILYLHGLAEANQQVRNAKRKELLMASHQDLEKLRSRINACSAFAKKLKALIQDISPGSKTLSSIDGLQERIKHAADAHNVFTRAFGTDRISGDLAQHHRLGVLAILAPTATATKTKPPKPELNTSDLVDVE